MIRLLSLLVGAMLNFFGGAEGESFTIRLSIQTPDCGVIEIGVKDYIWHDEPVITISPSIGKQIPFKDGGLHELVVVLNGQEVGRSGFMIVLAS